MTVVHNPFVRSILTTDEVDEKAKQLADAAVLGRPGVFGRLLVEFMINRMYARDYDDIGIVVLKMARILAHRDDILW
jgi:hypothetical protein